MSVRSHQERWICLKKLQAESGKAVVGGLLVKAQGFASVLVGVGILFGC